MDQWVDGPLTEFSGEGTGVRSVLVLDGTHEAEPLCSGLADRGWRVLRSSSRLLRTDGLDLVVLYGYRHIVPEHVLAGSVARVVNLHISYLPFNRGAHPGFWCFFDGSPCGVTIHEVDAGIDTGPILAQQLVDLDPWVLTFDEAYWRLRSAIEQLFFARLEGIADPAVVGRPQVGRGTQRRSSDLPLAFAGWSSTIAPEIERLHGLAERDRREAQRLIGEIEQVRSANNVNWMDILRLAFDSSPDRAREILGRINADDNRISQLLSALSQSATLSAENP
jgi:hypothetical protein